MNPKHQCRKNGPVSVVSGRIKNSPPSVDSGMKNDLMVGVIRFKENAAALVTVEKLTNCLCQWETRIFFLFEFNKVLLLLLFTLVVILLQSYLNCWESAFPMVIILLIKNICNKSSHLCDHIICVFLMIINKVKVIVDVLKKRNVLSDLCCLQFTEISFL